VTWRPYLSSEHPWPKCKQTLSQERSNNVSSCRLAAAMRGCLRILWAGHKAVDVTTRRGTLRSCSHCTTKSINRSLRPCDALIWFTRSTKCARKP
jgi:hypothetical protein